MIAGTVMFDMTVARLPEDGTRVIARDINGNYIDAVAHRKSVYHFVDYLDREPLRYEVTHWSPIKELS
jgi:hypothetical protein